MEGLYFHTDDFREIPIRKVVAVDKVGTLLFTLDGIQLREEVLRELEERFSRRLGVRVIVLPSIIKQIIQLEEA